MTTRTATEIQTELSTARRAYDNYNNVQNEGATDGFNPHLATIEKLAAELAEEKKASVSDKLSGDSLTVEKEWFNNQGFTRPDVAQKACSERGYNMSDLVAAIKASQ